MKLTTDYDRNQPGVFRRRHRQAQELPNKCPCEALADRVLQGDSPAQLHRWALHEQPANYLKQLIGALSPTLLAQPLPAGGQQFSHSANLQQWQSPAVATATAPGQFGQYSFDSLERSKPKQLGRGDCEQHRALFLAILAAERGGGFFTLLQSWGIPLANVHDGRGQGPLHWALQRQSLGCVQELLQLLPPEQLLAKDRKCLTPVHLAAAHRSARILKLLLEALPVKGDSQLVEALDEDGMTALHHAAAAGSEQCCEVLLGTNWRLPVDCRDSLGRTPLHLAAWTKAGASVARLLMAKKSIAASARDHRGWTPLHAAIMANNRPVLEALLEAMGQGAGQVFDNDSRTPLHVLPIKCPQSPIPKQYAALYDRAELAHLLIGLAGASNDTRDRFNVTAAHYAAQCGSFATLSAILGAANGIQQQPVDNEGRTPFMWAVIGQNEGIVREMLANKADANWLLMSKDHFKRNCLHLAALSGGMEMCKLLMAEANNSALNTEPDENGATPEHLAAGQGNSELVLWFGYQRGHLPPPLDDMDRTPFFHACLGGQVSTCEAMLRSLHLDPAHVDHLGRTALHCAVISGSLNCVKVLMESKLQFDPNLLDNNNKSALDIAREQKEGQEIVQYLEGRTQ